MGRLISVKLARIIFGKKAIASGWATGRVISVKPGRVFFAKEPRKMQPQQADKFWSKSKKKKICFGCRQMNVCEGQKKTCLGFGSRHGNF